MNALAPNDNLPFFDVRKVCIAKGQTYVSIDSQWGFSKNDLVDFEVESRDLGMVFRRTCHLIPRGNSLTVTIPAAWEFNAEEMVQISVTPRYELPRKVRELRKGGDGDEEGVCACEENMPAPPIPRNAYPKRADDDDDGFPEDLFEEDDGEW